MKKISALLFATCLYFSVSAQLTVDNTLTVEEYVQNVLLGAGVTVSNITFNGQPGNTVTVQLGSFDATNSNIGIPTGLIVSSGDINVAIGPNQSGSNTIAVGPWPEGSGVSDPDLEAINPGFTLNDAAVLEFDFIPNGDTLEFNYVWASDEYPEYVNSNFNDVFGFFLSGPGINGPYTNNAENIALIPGTNLPVTIDNVNNGNNGLGGPCVNCEYYVHNGMGFYDPYWGGTVEDSIAYYDPTVTNFDGFTTPLEAFSVVECGLEYHIKIAVADAGDQAFDSAVFLEEGSFTSNSVVDVDLEITVGVDEGILYEECGEAIMTFTRSPESDLTVEDLVLISYGGTAENGVDFTQMPDSVLFEVGVNQVSFNLDAFEDLIDEGTEDVQMTLLNLAACNGNGLESYFTFEITEVDSLQAAGDSLYLCFGDTLELNPEVWGGYGHYTYDWNTGDTDSALFLSPAVTTTYDVLIGDTCNMNTDFVSFIVTVSEPIFIDAGPDQIVSCVDLTNIVVDVQGGLPEFDYSWVNDDGIEISVQNQVNINTDENAVVTISVTDACENVAVDSVLFIVENPPIDIYLDDYVFASCLDDNTLEALVSGGAGNLNFTWTADGAQIGNETSVQYLTEENITVYFSVIDDCETEVLDSIFIDTSQNPPVVEVGDDIDASCIDINTLFAEVSGGQPGFEYEWHINGALVGTGNVINYQADSTVMILVTVIDECDFIGQDSLNITIPDIPIELELTADTVLCLGSAMGLYALASGGEEGFTYYWPELEDEGNWTQIEPNFPGIYTVVATDICGVSESAEVYIDVQYVSAHAELEYVTESLIDFTGSFFPEECEGCTFEWDFGDGSGSDQLNVLHEYQTLAEYTATFEVTNEIGCSSSTYLIVNPPIHIYVPNAFTPDGDGLNDVFLATGQGITSFELFVFNRWGEEVFYSDDINVPWIGNHKNGDHYVQSGIYSYLIKYKGVTGDAIKTYGHINVLR